VPPVVVIALGFLGLLVFGRRRVPLRRGVRVRRQSVVLRDWNAWIPYASNAIRSAIAGGATDAEEIVKEVWDGARLPDPTSSVELEQTWQKLVAVTRGATRPTTPNEGARLRIVR